MRPVLSADVHPPEQCGARRRTFRPRRHTFSEAPDQLKPRPPTTRSGTFINLSVCADLQRTILVERRRYAVRRATWVHVLIAYQGAVAASIPSDREGL